MTCVQVTEAAGKKLSKCPTDCEVDKDCRKCSDITKRSINGTCNSGKCNYCVFFSDKNPNQCDGNGEFLPCCGEPGGSEVECVPRYLDPTKKVYECRSGFEACLKSCKSEEDCTCSLLKRRALSATCTGSSSEDPGICSYCVNVSPEAEPYRCGYVDTDSTNGVGLLPCCRNPRKPQNDVECQLHPKGRKTDASQYKCFETCIPGVDKRLTSCHDSEGYVAGGRQFLDCKENGEDNKWRYCKVGGKQGVCGAVNVKCKGDGSIPCCDGYVCENGKCRIDCNKATEKCGGGRTCCAFKAKQLQCSDGKCS